MDLWFVTGNEDKYGEAKRVIEEIKRIEIDLDEIQSIDPVVVIEHKLRQALKAVSEGILIVEDNSLVIEGMNGLPGPLIKWFLKTVGNDGLVKMAGEFGSGGAEARVVVGVLLPGKEPEYFDGIIKGKIVAPRGINSFGWDPIFLPEGLDKTFGEMTKEEKNAISMRRMAFEKLKDYLRSVGVVFNS